LTWGVEFTDEFHAWWSELNEGEQDAVGDGVELLKAEGPMLVYPHSSGITTSRHPRMRELRVQRRGRPLRVLYAFDPRRCAILLIGGDKAGDDRFYERMVPLADRLYDVHLEALKREGLI
jgi:hypothetical protein